MRRLQVSRQGLGGLELEEEGRVEADPVVPLELADDGHGHQRVDPQRLEGGAGVDLLWSAAQMPGATIP